MFSDSHAHFFMIFQKNKGDISFFNQMVEKKYRFVMDIGTEPADLAKRKQVILDAFNGNIPDFIHFAAGLWPHAESIANPKKALASLKNDIDSLILKKNETNAITYNKPFYCALGECGLDRYWNKPYFEKDKIKSDTLEKHGTTDIAGEEFLFKEQLKIAKTNKLPVIIHSRDAYNDTIKCIDEIGYHKGVIHCYSYGIKEAKEFLDRGWYISFPGNITYAKKQKDKDAIAELIKSIPRNKLLLETDAPYLTPAPFRGKVNTPIYIEYTYSLISEILKISMEELAEEIYHNCCSCFSIQ